MMEAVHWLVAPVGTGRLDELLPPHGLEQRRKWSAGAGELAQRAKAELGSDDRCELEHRALVIGESLDARCEERLDSGRHFNRVRVDRELPLAVMQPDDLIVHEHAYELPNEQR